MMSEKSDVSYAQAASRSFVKELLHAGIKVYMYQKGFLHSKLMVFDDTLTLIGSVNFDSRSFEHNFEVEAFIYNHDLAKQANEIFVEDQRFSRVISLREWAKRPAKMRLFESFMRLFTPLL